MVNHTMVKCSYCGSTIFFGGSREGALRFCNATCHENSDRLSAELVGESAQPPEFRLARSFWIALITLVVGSAPLLLFMLLTKDPHPNPVGLGFIAFLTFWPSVILMLSQVQKSLIRYRAVRKRYQNHLAEQNAPPNSRPPSQLPSSPEDQSSDSLRTPRSGGCG